MEINFGAKMFERSNRVFECLHAHIEMSNGVSNYQRIEKQNSGEDGKQSVKRENFYLLWFAEHLKLDRMPKNAADLAMLFPSSLILPFCSNNPGWAAIKISYCSLIFYFNTVRPSPVIYICFRLSNYSIPKSLHFFLQK